MLMNRTELAAGKQARRSAPKAPVRKTAAKVLRERNCSVGRTIDVIGGDGWTFMVLRECYFNVRKFEKFQQILGLPRTTLAARLNSLTVQGVLRQVQYSDKPPRYEYALTKMGIDLYPVMLALMTFGDRWLAGKEGKPLQLVHNVCGKKCSALVVCSECKQELKANRVSYRDGPGAGTSPMRPGQRGRRSADPTALERRRPSSVARALRVIGDRWSFMVIREGFFRVKRFDELQSRLGIAPNILADRLSRLVAEGIFEKVKYQSQPDRYEYKFTEKGKDLFGPLLAMLRWGDDWLSGGEPPLLLTHLDCNKDFKPVVACDQCLEALAATQMRYQMHYRDPAQE
jgi:DNA-binding HxlR family transcriptional regulator